MARSGRLGHDDATATGWSLGLAGKTYVVTGAASGIGRDAAIGLAETGAHVVAVDLDVVGLQALADGTPAVAPIAGDCTEETVAEAAVCMAEQRFGRLDGLVSNVGIAVTGRLEELSSEAWNRSLSVNLTSHFMMTRSIMRHLATSGSGGALVYVASKNAYNPGAGFGAYSVAKAGLVQLARLAAVEGAAAGIRANIVSPDNVFENSKLWSADIRAMRAREHGVEPGQLESFYQQRNLLHERVLPRDVVRAIAYFLSDLSGKTTGCVLTVDGGLTAVFPR